MLPQSFPYERDSPHLTAEFRVQVASNDLALGG